MRKRHASQYANFGSLPTTIDRMLFDLYGLTEEERKVIGYIEIK